METLTAILVIVVLTLIEAVFVAAEISLVTVRRTRLEQLADEGSRSARRVQRVVATPARYLAVVQIGLTFVGFLAAAFAAVTLTNEMTTAAPAAARHLGRAGRPHRRDAPAGPVHDRLRRARAQVARRWPTPRGRPSSSPAPIEFLMSLLGPIVWSCSRRSPAPSPGSSARAR